jgi:hypothetical protein
MASQKQVVATLAEQTEVLKHYVHPCDISEGLA